MEFSDIQSDGCIIAIVKKLSAKCLSILPSDSGYAFEDLMQEAWIAIFKALPKFEEDKNIRTFVWVVVSNRFKNLVRKNKTIIDAVPLSNYSEEYDDLLDVLLDPDCFDYERHCMFLQIVEALKDVSEDFAKVLTDGISRHGGFWKALQLEYRVNLVRFGGNSKNSKRRYLITDKFLERFFDLDIEDIRKLVYKYLE